MSELSSTVRVPTEHQIAAEQIRAHLVFLRGGAPFLSPADSLQLVRWLDEGVATVSVLTALERASLARRKSPSKRRLTLMSAKRHLGKAMPKTWQKRGQNAFGLTPRTTLCAGEPNNTGMVTGQDVHPYAQLSGMLTSESDQRLLHALTALPVDTSLPLAALSTLRAHAQTVWDELGDPGRTRLRETASQHLGELLQQVDETTAVALIDEAAQDLLRQRWPHCTLALFADLAEGNV